MNAIEDSPVRLPNWTPTTRGIPPSRGRREPTTAKAIAAVAVALLLALTLAQPAQAFTWGTDTVDSPGTVGLWTSIALDSSGDPHISYYDQTNLNLKYARQLLPWLWVTETVDSAGRVGEFSSIALDPIGYPHIAYVEFVSIGNRDLKYARKLPGGGWSAETVDAEGDVGWFPSIAVDSSGQPHISYYDFDNGSGAGKLKYARRTTSGNWSIETVDSAGDVGAYTSIALDSSGRPHISYFDFTNGNLKYARRVCTTVEGKSGALGTFCFWSKVTVDAGDVTSGFTSIALDSSGLPHISYTVFGGGYPEVKYARRLSSGSWLRETVDTGGVGMHTSVAVDSSGLAHISYPDNTNGTLKHARKLPSGVWSRETVDTGSAGQNSIALDANGNPHVSYYDGVNGDLKYAKGDPRLSHLP
jgi:hypothetical protein